MTATATPPVPAPSFFAQYEPLAFPFQYQATIVVGTIAGGIPSNPNVAESWLKTKIGDRDEQLRQAVAETMVERGITAEAAAEEVNQLQHLNGFKRTERGILYLEGRCMKACLKEAVNVAANEGKITSKGWGNPDNKNYLKGIKAWFPEHVFVVDDKLLMGVTEPTDIVQRFVHTPRGTGIQYEEYVDDAKMEFVVETDHEFTEEQWAMIWLTAERQGIGASRSQGFGRFTITEWNRIEPEPASA
jgi:hypothetical protein